MLKVVNYGERRSSNSVNGSHVLQKVVFVAGNCLLANKGKNYNSMGSES